MLKILPYILISILIIIYWRIQTLINNYAWNPKGKQTLFLDIALTSIFYYKTIFWLTIGSIVVFIFQSESKKQRIKVLIGIFTLLFIYIFGGEYTSKKCANFYYIVFQNQSVSEEYLEEPIIKGGYEVGKYLTENIEDKNMKYRRYAISGIGKIKYDKAIPILEKILKDKSEPDFIKNDILESLKQINNYEANIVLKNYKE